MSARNYIIYISLLRGSRAVVSAPLSFPPPSCSAPSAALARHKIDLPSSDRLTCNLADRRHVVSRRSVVSHLRLLPIVSASVFFFSRIILLLYIHTHRHAHTERHTLCFRPFDPRDIAPCALLSLFYARECALSLSLCFVREQTSRRHAFRSKNSVE